MTVFVPVVDSFNDDGPRIRVTSLGEWTIDDGGDVDLFFLIIWALVVAIAALGAAFAPARWWDVTAVIIAALIVLVLFSYLVSPPVLMWDGQLPDGTPTGGMEVGRRSFGFGLWLIGAAALVAAGICGLLMQTKRARPAVQGPPAGGV